MRKPITRCPFCGRGTFSRQFINQQLAGLYGSASINAMRAYAMEKAVDKLEVEILRLKRSRNRAKTVATRKALQSVCNLLKYYNLQPTT